MMCACRRLHSTTRPMVLFHRFCRRRRKSQRLGRQELPRVSPSSEKDSRPWAWRRALAASGPDLAPPSASMEEGEAEAVPAEPMEELILGVLLAVLCSPGSPPRRHPASLLLASAAIPALEPPSCLPVCVLFSPLVLCSLHHSRTC
jgi:hypothetical protein